MTDKNWTARHLALLLATILLVVNNAAAQKLYNSRRDKVMQDTKKQFEELTGPDADIFEKAIKNVDATNDADLEQMRERNRVLVDSVATTMPFMTWGELQTMLFDARRQALAIMRPDMVAPDLSGDLSQAQKEVDTLKGQIKTYDEVYDKQAPTIDELQKAFREAIDSGRPVSWKDIPDKVKSWSGDFDSLRELVLRVQPQGLKRVMLEASLLRIQNELQRLQLQQEHRKARLEARTQYSDHVRAYTGDYEEKADCSTPHKPDDWVRFGKFSKPLQTICDSRSHEPTHLIVADLQNLAKQAGGTSGESASANRTLVNELVNLTRVMDLLGTARYNLFAEHLQLSHDELVYHIRVTKLNVQEHQILLHAGITGLTAYEAGGIKPEDVANIIGTAQSLATAAIAARVK